MLYIRVDMNREIATGHLMRCLAIADAARMSGEETTFLLADKEAAELLTRRQYPFIVLGTDWRDMEGELECLLEVIHRNHIASLLVDSYQVTPRYLHTLRQAVRLVYLDDLNRFLYPVDALICYAAYYEKFRYTERYPRTELYLGPRYAPLRREFSGVGQKEIRPRIERILVLSGGTDPFHSLESVTETTLTETDSVLDVICGRYHPDYEKLTRHYHHVGRVRLHRSVDNLVDYMRQADLAVSAGGTTLYELCACGTPAISYAIADNQLDNVRYLDEHNYIDSVGDMRCGSVGRQLAELFDKYEESIFRAKRSALMQSLVDGKGAGRIAKIL